MTRRNLETSLGVLETRFPLPSVIAVILTGLFLSMINGESTSTVILRTILSLIVTFFLSIGVTFFAENRKRSQLWWQIIPLVYGALFYITVNPIMDEFPLDSVTYFILHLVGFICLLFFAPYCTRLFYPEKQSVEYTNYFSRTAWTLLMSTIVGGALVALGFIAISSVIALFDLSSFVQESKIYGNWAVISLSLIAPLYGLIHLPQASMIEKRTYEINRFFSFLIRYIAIPFIVLYFIILYAYSVRVLMNFHDWPKGMISWMVVGFSTFGYITYIFSKPYEDESAMVRVVRKLFPYVVPAQIVMLGYAIYLRIAQYDLTMNRYFVVIFGCWLAIISLYYIVSKRKSLTIITATLATIALVISIGPWSVYHLPMDRQYHHLIDNLTKTGMLHDGIISKKIGTLDPNLENTLYSEIEYICGFDHCALIKNLFASELAKSLPEYEQNWLSNSNNVGKPYPGMMSWEVVTEVTSALDISYRPLGVEDTNRYITIGVKSAYDESVFPIDTTGFTTLLKVYTKDVPTMVTGKHVTIDPEAESLTLVGYGPDVVFSLKSFDTTLRQKYTLSNMNLDTTELTTTLQSGNIRLKLILQSYAFLKANASPTKNPYEYGNIGGYALIKK